MFAQWTVDGHTERRNSLVTFQLLIQIQILICRLCMRTLEIQVRPVNTESSKNKT